MRNPIPPTNPPKKTTKKSLEVVEKNYKAAQENLQIMKNKWDGESINFFGTFEELDMLRLGVLKEYVGVYAASFIQTVSTQSDVTIEGLLYSRF